MTTTASADKIDRRPSWPRRGVGLLVLGIVATSLCLAAEAWLMLELLTVLPDGVLEPEAIERLADTGKAIAGATGATLIVRGLIDRTARQRRLGLHHLMIFSLVWLAIGAGIYKSLVEVTDAIVDSLPATARQDAVLIALYRKNVQDGTMADPDYGPRGTLSDLQRVKAINAAIGLLDRERDYARRFEGRIQTGAEARKTQIVRQAEQQTSALRARLDAARQPYLELAEGRPGPTAATAWSAYDALWKAPPETRAALLNSSDSDLLPAWPEPPIRALTLADVPPGLDRAGFGRFVADALTSRRDAALWAIEDRALAALDELNRRTQIALDPAQERQLVLSVVVPPLALSFGAIGIIANATALVLLAPAFLAMIFTRQRRDAILRAIRPASVVLPWLTVAAAMVIAPAVPFADDQGFSRIVRQTREAPDVALWTDLWLRMIGVEAQLLGSLPGRG